MTARISYPIFRSSSIMAASISFQPTAHQQLRWPNKKPRIAYVLSGGGVRGISHAGSMAALEEAGIQPDLIVGCSAGAIAGALYAAVPSAAYVKKVLLEIAPYSKSFRFLGIPSLYKGIRGGGFFSLKRMGRLLQKKISVTTFEELQIPLMIVATNLSKGHLTVFQEGELIPPVCASSAIPGFFQPLYIEGDYYGDGAILRNVPVPEAKATGAQLIIAFNINNHIDIDPPSMNNLFQRSLMIAFMHRGNKFASKADVVINPVFRGENNILVSEQKLRLLYRSGREAAEKMIPVILQKLSDLGA